MRSTNRAKFFLQQNQKASIEHLKPAQLRDGDSFRKFPRIPRLQHRKPKKAPKARRLHKQDQNPAFPVRKPKSKLPKPIQKPNLRNRARLFPQPPLPLNPRPETEPPLRILRVPKIPAPPNPINLQQSYPKNFQLVFQPSPSQPRPQIQQASSPKRRNFFTAKFEAAGHLKQRPSDSTT